MSSHFPPLSCRQVKLILKNLGFSPLPRTGTSHEQWVKHADNRIYRVTVDCPKEPFSHTLIKYMAAQAGVNKKQFYKALNQ
jgi:predicted RNA binding protein YcfA (HicA-like mRNA interferase family)